MGMFGDIGGGIGDIAGNIASRGDRDQAMGYLQDAEGGFSGLNPNITAQQTGGSAYSDADPQTRAAQMDALSQLRNQVNQGGLDSISRANMAQAQNANNNMARTQQAGIMQAAQARGAGNSGNTLLGQMVAGQSAANQNAGQGLQIAGYQQQARQQATGQIGQMAAGIRGQDYQRAAALDAINRFNAGQRQNAQQETFANGLNQAGGEANVYGAMAGQANGNAQQTQNLWGGVGRAAGGVGDAANQMGQQINPMSQGGGGGSGGGGGGGGGAAGGAAGMLGDGSELDGLFSMGGAAAAIA